MKIAGHELLSLDTLMSCKIDQLRFPLVSLVDYRGYRLLAISLLPIHNGTLQYGSSDAGKTIHSNINSEADNLVRDVCAKLNLKPHQIRHDNIVHTIYGPVDLECHLGEDGNFYLVDFSRVFPPDKLDHSKKCGYLYQILRPELVRANPYSLCSDSLTKFVNDKPEKLKNEIEEVNRNLTQNIIPSYCNTILCQDAHRYTLKQFIDSVHRQGINIRYLGVLFVHMRNNRSNWKYKILVEVIARACKRLLNHKFREVQNESAYLSSPDFESEKNDDDSMDTNYLDPSKSVDDHIYWKIIVHFFNQLFAVQTRESVAFWNELPPVMEQYFNCPLDCFENIRINEEYPMFYCELFERVQTLTNIQFLHEKERGYGSDPNFVLQATPFNYPESIQIKSKLKHVTFMQYCYGMIHKYKAKASTCPTEKQKFFSDAVNIFLKALEYNSSNTDCLLQIASICKQTGNIPAAAQYYRIVANATNHSNAKIHYKVARFFHKLNSKDADKYYVHALTADPNAEGFIDYANFLWQVKEDYNTSLKSFVKACARVSWDSPYELSKRLAYSFRDYLRKVSPTMTEAEINAKVTKEMPYFSFDEEEFLD